MTDTFTDEDLTGRDEWPGNEEVFADANESEADGPDLAWLEAPEIAGLIKGVKTGKARDYERKAQSALKTIARFRYQSGTDTGLADAAAIFAFGPDFASATGALAAENETAAKIVDMVTAPDSPALMFTIAAIPFVAQMFRNHQAQIAEVPAKWRNRKKPGVPRAEKKKIRVGFGRLKFSVSVPPFFNVTPYIMQNSVEPEALATAVFGNPDVAKALRKFGWTNARA